MRPKFGIFDFGWVERESGMGCSGEQNKRKIEGVFYI
jgi:hypothetical protein